MLTWHVGPTFWASSLLPLYIPQSPSLPLSPLQPQPTAGKEVPSSTSPPSSRAGSVPGGSLERAPPLQVKPHSPGRAPSHLTAHTHTPPTNCTLYTQVTLEIHSLSVPTPNRPRLLLCGLLDRLLLPHSLTCQCLKEDDMGSPPPKAEGPRVQLQKLLASWLLREQDWDQHLDEAHMLQQKR